MKFTGKLLILFGIFSIFFGLFLSWQRVNPNRIAFQSVVVSANENIAIKPSELNFLDINLPIFESRIENQKWETTDKGVSRIGNIYYGHNYPNLLGNLTKIKPNDIIEIKHTDNSIKKYKVMLTQEVNPDQKDILNLANDNKILIYTCSGFLDSKRFIVVAEKI